MTLQTIFTGTNTNDQTGTPAQTAFQIINANFAQLGGTIPITFGPPSPAAGPAVTVAGAAGFAAMSINAGTGGTGLTVNQSGSTGGINVLSATGTANLYLAGSGVAATSGLQISQNGTVATILNNAASSLQLGTNAAVNVTIGSGGNVTIATPTSGIGLSLSTTSATIGNAPMNVVTIASGYCITFSDGTNTTAGISFDGSHNLQIGSNSGSYGMEFISGGRVSLTAGTTGGCTIPTPSSGSALTLNGSSATPALTLTNFAANQPAINFTNAAFIGANTATFSATNKPGTGTTAPTLWLPIQLNGTTYFIPCWL